MKMPHYTQLLKAFVAGSRRITTTYTLRRLELIDYGAGVFYLTKRGEERARRLGYLKEKADG